MYRVILAANNHPDYSFLIPLTAILWRERTMYKPLCIVSDALLAGDLRKLGFDVGSETFFNDRMEAKLSRWYSHSQPGVDRDDVLLLADVDAWPIDGAYWNRTAEKPVTCFYGDAYQGRRHCTHGFRATAMALKEICGGGMHGRIDELRKLPMDDERRYSDDCAQSELFLKWMEGREQFVEILTRGPSPPKDRIDRSAWPESFNLTGKVDAHLPRDASDRRVWLQIRPLFRALAPGWADWADSYYESWARGIV